MALPTLAYFDLSGFRIFGRGGVVRLFLLGNGIQYQDQTPLPKFDDSWPVLKKKLQESGENPSGHLPVLYDDKLVLSECNAIARYLARKNDKLRSAQIEAVSDMVADKVVTLRDSTINGLLGDDATKAKHKEERRKQYQILDDVLKTHADSSTGLLSGDDGITLGDAAVFAIAYDDARIFGKPEGSYPHLDKLVSTVGSKKFVQDWFASNNYGESSV